jgi:endonuclease/exonuclease/phosphatase family metal-dependent hydrolase
MKIPFLTLFLFTFPFCSLFSQSKGNVTLTVVTYNIRLNTPDDGINAWPNRIGKVTGLIKKQQPSIFGLQEVLSGQLADIRAAFPEYGFAGVGRDDGRNAGEFSPVFYNKGTFELKKSGTFWLSQTPSVAGSRGWDAACNRVVSWVILRDKKTGKSFGYFNTHFDHMGEIARRNSSILLLHAVDSLATGLPVIVTGDFNSPPGSEPVQILLASSGKETALLNSKQLALKTNGPSITYTGFEVGGIPGETIDYIFIRNIPRVLEHTVVDEHSGKYYPSDHLPVVARLSF